jgi:Adipokinetic hormone
MFSDTAANSVPQSMGCNPKMDSMLLIYRLIQNEAQKLLECNSQTK